MNTGVLPLNYTQGNYVCLLPSFLFHFRMYYLGERRTNSLNTDAFLVKLNVRIFVSFVIFTALSTRAILNYIRVYLYCIVFDIWALDET